MGVLTHTEIAVVDIQFTGLDKFKQGDIIKVMVDQDIYEYYILVVPPSQVNGVAVNEAIDNKQLLKLKYGTTIEGENGKFLFKSGADRAYTSPYLQHNPIGTNSALNIDTTVDDNNYTPLRIFTHSGKILQAYTATNQFVINQYGAIGAGININETNKDYALYSGRANAVKAKDGFGWDISHYMKDRTNYVTGYPATGQGKPEDGYYWLDTYNKNLVIYNTSGHFGFFKGKSSVVGNKPLKYSGIIFDVDSWIYMPRNNTTNIKNWIENWKSDNNNTYPEGGQIIYENEKEEFSVRRKSNSNEWKFLAVQTNGYVNYDVIVSQNDNYNSSSTLGTSLKYNWNSGTLGINVDVTSPNINVYDFVAGKNASYLAYSKNEDIGDWAGYNFGLGSAYPAQARIDLYKNVDGAKNLIIRVTSSKYKEISKADRIRFDMSDDHIEFINLPNGLKLINNDGEANDTKRAMMFVNFIANDDNAKALLEPLDKPTFVLGGLKESDNSSFVIYWTDGNGNVYKDELWGWQIN